MLTSKSIGIQKFILDRLILIHDEIVFHNPEHRLMQKYHQEGSCSAVYSYSVDEQNLVIYIFLNHDYTKYQKFDVRKEISRGAHQIRLTIESLTLNKT